MQRRFFARWGLLRQIAEAVDELGEEQVRAMHPLFYKKGELPSSVIAADLIPENWEVVKDVVPTLKSASDLDIVPVLESDDNASVLGEEMRRRAVAKKANLGLADLKVAMDDKTEILAEARPYCIVFSGTLLRRPDGGLFVACLSWGDDRWVVRFIDFAVGWGNNDRLVRCK